MKPQTTDEAMAKIKGCAPQTAVAGNVHLAIRSLTVEPRATKITIVATAIGEPADFDLPVYRLSRGRWLIQRTGRAYLPAGRAYLLDEDCREYKLKDRKSLPGFEIPLEGRIRLRPDRPFEAVLEFPRVSDRARVGMLVYDGRSLPLRFGAEGR